MKDSEILNFSVQINDGLSETSADGVSLAFDKKYGIMFASYMPGMQGSYGESRGRIMLSYFPASQPTNLKTVEIARGSDVYCNNILSLGEAVKERFGEKCEPLYERLAKFFQILDSYNFIYFKE